LWVFADPPPPPHSPPPTTPKHRKKRKNGRVNNPRHTQPRNTFTAEKKGKDFWQRGGIKLDPKRLKYSTRANPPQRGIGIKTNQKRRRFGHHESECLQHQQEDLSGVSVQRSRKSARGNSSRRTWGKGYSGEKTKRLPKLREL